jgi:phosphate/sulfate permease
MVGWKRIVVTVGEKIGKTHLTYAQGACAEITAAATIAAADVYGLPVSTTHVAIFRHRRHHGGERFRVAALYYA